MLSLKYGAPEIDLPRFVIHGNFNTLKTAQNTWGVLKKKLVSAIPPVSDGGKENDDEGQKPTTPSPPAKDKAKGSKTSGGSAKKRTSVGAKKIKEEVLGEDSGAAAAAAASIEGDGDDDEGQGDGADESPKKKKKVKTPTKTPTKGAAAAKGATKAKGKGTSKAKKVIEDQDEDSIKVGGDDDKSAEDKDVVYEEDAVAYLVEEDGVKKEEN
jgi:hypothetical protein